MRTVLGFRVESWGAVEEKVEGFYCTNTTFLGSASGSHKF